MKQPKCLIKVEYINKLQYVQTYCTLYNQEMNKPQWHKLLIYISKAWDVSKEERQKTMYALVFSHAHSCGKNNDKNKSGKYNLNVSRKRRFVMWRDMYDTGDANIILVLLRGGCYSGVWFYVIKVHYISCTFLHVHCISQFRKIL